MRFVDEFESYVNILESKADSILEGKPYQKLNLAYLHSGIMRLGLATKKENKKEAIEFGKKLIDHLNSVLLDSQCSLNFKILITLLMFANESEEIDQGELLKMKKDFATITDKIGTNDEYEVYYSGVGLFGTLVQILQAMGIHFDPKIPLKYEQMLYSQKLTYIKFFSSLESYLDPAIEESIDICLKF